MDNAMIPSLLLVPSLLLRGVLALLVLLIIRARRSGLPLRRQIIRQLPVE